MRRGLLLAAGVLSAASAAQADYKEDFRKGLEAHDKGKWNEAARLMRSAAAAQAAEGEQIKLYGVRFEWYLPQFYLGSALYKSGDCQGALQAWKTSEEQGAIVKQNQKYKELQKNRAICETQLAESKPAKPEETKTPEPTRVADTKPPTPDPALAQARQAAEAELARAQQAADRAAAMSRDAALAPTWGKDAALGGKQKQAMDQLASARTKLDSGKDTRALQDAREQASRAARDLEAVYQEGAQRKQRLAQAPRPEKTPEATATTAAVGPPPAELLSAARAYFAGDYRRAADTLAGVDYPAGKAAAQARLFRAAARFALFVSGGQSDDALRKAAADDVQACRSLEPALVPDAQAFSPRFVAFFQKSR